MTSKYRWWCWGMCAVSAAIWLSKQHQLLCHPDTEYKPPSLVTWQQVECFNTSPAGSQSQKTQEVRPLRHTNANKFFCLGHPHKAVIDIQLQVLCKCVRTRVNRKSINSYKNVCDLRCVYETPPYVYFRSGICLEYVKNG